MSRRIYPLNALRAFESSARQLSFVKASEELSVTPAAISHQVKSLEEYLGFPLFRRKQKGLTLTESGKLLLSELSEAFVRLDKAMERVIENDSRGALTLTVAPTFASMWLIPHLQNFYFVGAVAKCVYRRHDAVTGNPNEIGHPLGPKRLSGRSMPPVPQPASRIASSEASATNRSTGAKEIRSIPWNHHM